eukprot:12266117-Alexandrium_andersonii.AAC.1
MPSRAHGQAIGPPAALPRGATAPRTSRCSLGGLPPPRGEAGGPGGGSPLGRRRKLQEAPLAI